MTYRVRILPEALAQIEALDRWWRTNRSSAASAVTDELARITTLLVEFPQLGSPHGHATVQPLRRCRLRRTPYSLYYVLDDDAAEIVVVAMWSSSREHGPPLG